MFTNLLFIPFGQFHIFNIPSVDAQVDQDISNSRDYGGNGGSFSFISIIIIGIIMIGIQYPALHLTAYIADKTGFSDLEEKHETIANTILILIWCGVNYILYNAAVWLLFKIY